MLQRLRMVAGVVVGLAVALSAAGCTANLAADDAPAEWVAPGWMAQVRQQNEEYVAAKKACLAEFGVKAIVGLGGPGVGVGGITDESGNLPPGVQALQDEADRICSERIPSPAYQADPIDSGAYARMLDVRNRLIAQGIDIPLPPTEQAWLEQGGNAWNPYEVLLSPPAPIDNAEFARLTELCPQSGPGMMVVIPDNAFD